MGRTLAETIEAEATQIFLNTEEMAVTVTRYAGGSVLSATPIDAIWMPGSPVRDDSSGENIDRPSSLLIPADQEVVLGDAFLILGLVYQLDRPGEIEHGLREIFVKRSDRQSTSRTPMGLR